MTFPTGVNAAHLCREDIAHGVAEVAFAQATPLGVGVVVVVGHRVPAVPGHPHPRRRLPGELAAQEEVGAVELEAQQDEVGQLA